MRRTKEQVLPQLPAKRHDTVPVLLSNEQEYRLAERDVIAWLQTLPLDLRTLDAKVAAALRAEQLVRLNNLRQLAVRGKLPTALAWIADFLASGEPLVVFAEHVATQHAVLERFPDAEHILGADSTQNRQRAVDAFQREDGPQLIVCSMKAASQGLTLTRASNVAFLELDWTPARHDQAEDRLHRIGQESAVTAWYLLAPEHDRRDDGRAAAAQAQPDRRGHRRRGARRGAAGGRGHPRAARQAVPAPARGRLARALAPAPGRPPSSGRPGRNDVPLRPWDKSAALASGHEPQRQPARAQPQPEQGDRDEPEPRVGQGSRRRDAERRDLARCGAARAVRRRTWYA